MRTAVPETVLSRLSDFVAQRVALYFPRERWGDLERKAGAAAKEFGFEDLEAFSRWLLSAPVSQEQAEMLASYLTISETYFWREPQVFEALVNKILPELIAARRAAGDLRLRLWSAGCATGEEPYSLAMALRRALPDLDGWKVTILATDINPLALRRAAEGVYGQWSFRNAPPWLKEHYFTPCADGKHRVKPAIRKMVNFEYLNLADDAYPSPLNNTGAMDIIFCRNVLMYFSAERARRSGLNLHRCLADGGWFMVSACELSPSLFPGFTPVHFPSAIVYRKAPQNSAAAPVFLPENFSFPEAAEVPPGRPERPAPAAPPAPARPAAAAASQDAYSEALGLYERGSYAAAINRLESDGTPRALALKVRSLGNVGRLAEALALCEKAVVAAKLEPGLHYLHAAILQELNREPEGAAALKRALYLDPGFVAAHFSLGNLALRSGKMPAAKKHFDNALALLAARGQDEVVPESDGLTAGRFREIVLATARTGAL